MPGSRSASAWHQSSRGSRTGPSSCARWSTAAREAGATGVWTNLLNLRPGTREHFLEHLAEDFPEQVQHYQELYRGGRAYLPKAEAAPVREEVAALARELGVRDRRRVPLDGTQHDEQLSLAV